MSRLLELKGQIKGLIKEYYNESFKPKEFIPGETTIPVSGKVFDENELFNIADSGLDGWFTTGRFNTEFEKKLARYINIRTLITVNSGSSANLIAFSTLTAEELGDEAIKPGDEVITVAASFPTTVNPIIQYGCVPVFLDIDIPTYEINVEHLEKALSEKTKAVVVAHTLGNVFNLHQKFDGLQTQHQTGFYKLFPNAPRLVLPTWVLLLAADALHPPKILRHSALPEKRYA